MERLQDSLRRSDIFVSGSDHWGDTRAKLLPDVIWKNKRIQISASLGHSLDPKLALKTITDQLDAAYKKATKNFKDNGAVRIEKKKEKPLLILANLEKLEEPPRLLDLRKKIENLLPKVGLPELLLEVHAHTGYCEAFTHVSESLARANNLSVSISAVLLAESCNIGLEPLVDDDNPSLSRNRLSWVQQNYFRADTITQANACLVNHQMRLPLAKIWGDGDIASADGLRFVTTLKTINSGPNRKYFGSARGITYYNFTSDQFTGFHGVVIPGTIRDSIFILEGLLEQQTSLQPKEVMTDTAGTSEIIFGLFWLLGYQFSPRIVHVGGTRFWRIDPKADYGVLNELSTQRVNMDRVKENWEDMLRIAGSLKLGTVSASELISSLLKTERPSSLTKALAELGRIPKTIYLLNYMDDEAYRRRILTQLNRGEGRHSVARTICYGKLGEIRKHYREGQEDQLSALGFVTNAVVLWNTIYIQKALDKLQEDGLEIFEEDIARLSPLQYKHINVLGRYSFTINENVMKGELRQLNCGPK